MVATLTTMALLAAAGHGHGHAVVHLHPGDRVAAIVARRRPGTTFVFGRGVYRLVRTVRPRTGDRLLGRPGATLSGGRPVKGWHRRGRVWVAGGQTQRPHLNHGAPGQTLRYPQARYDDDLFFGTRPLWKIGVRIHGHVIGEPRSRLRPGTYFLDYDRNRVWVGSNPHHHRPRMAWAPTLIESTAAKVTVSGLVLQLSAERGVSALGRGWHVSGNTVRLNGGIGIVTSGRALVERNVVLRNGVYGITGHGVDITVRDNTVAENDVARVDPASGCNDAGGSKWVKTRRLHVTGNLFEHNYCNGIWLDIENRDSVVSGNRSIANVGSGIVHEISGRAEIRGNVVRRNGGFGILVRSSRGDDVSANTVTGNARGAIVVYGSRRSDHTRDGHVHLARNVSVHGNVMTLSRAAMRVGILGDGSDPGVFDAASNHFDHNTYQLPFAAARVFEFRRALDLAAWRAAGEDAHSTFTWGQ